MGAQSAHLACTAGALVVDPSAKHTHKPAGCPRAAESEAPDEASVGAGRSVWKLRGQYDAEGHMMQGWGGRTIGTVDT